LLNFHIKVCGGSIFQESRVTIAKRCIDFFESLRNLDKVTDNSLLPRYLEIDWKKVKGMRDIISHHYFDLNAEVIFNVCNDKIDDLGRTVNKMIKDLS